jgi:uncharacterized protein
MASFTKRYLVGRLACSRIINHKERVSALSYINNRIGDGIMDKRNYYEGRKGNYIQTFSGIRFYLLDPRAEDVNAYDIAHSLSNNCRFTGHTKEFYSVATHSILCADQARKDGMSAKIQLYCLLHDGSEAYLNDIARPLKEILGTLYTDMEDTVQEVIYEQFGLPQPTEEEWKTVKFYDDFLLANEIGQLMVNSEDFGIEPIYNGVHFPRGYSNVQTRNRFLEILEQLIEEYKEEIGNE